MLDVVSLELCSLEKQAHSVITAYVQRRKTANRIKGWRGLGTVGAIGDVGVVG